MTPAKRQVFNSLFRCFWLWCFLVCHSHSSGANSKLQLSDSQVQHQIQPITHVWTSGLRHFFKYFLHIFLHLRQTHCGTKHQLPRTGGHQSEALGSSRLPLVGRIGDRLSPASQYCRVPGGQTIKLKALDLQADISCLHATNKRH